MRRAVEPLRRDRAAERLLPLTNTAVPRLNRGVRLRNEPDGSTLLLVPEGIVRLNDTAAAVLALVDGTRTIEGIVDALGERFDAPRDDLAHDVAELIDRLTLRGYVTS